MVLIFSKCWIRPGPVCTYFGCHNTCESNSTAFNQRQTLNGNHKKMICTSRDGFIGCFCPTHIPFHKLPDCIIEAVDQTCFSLFNMFRFPAQNATGTCHPKVFGVDILKCVDSKHVFVFLYLKPLLSYTRAKFCQISCQKVASVSRGGAGAVSQPVPQFWDLSVNYGTHSHTLVKYESDIAKLKWITTTVTPWTIILCAHNQAIGYQKTH